jgi:hypothetical protein
MDLPHEVISLENRSTGQHGEPMLAAACTILASLWDDGDRGRELGLHLMFLCWYCLIEPEHLTGLDPNSQLAARLSLLFQEVHDFFVPSMEHDAEMLYVVGLMAHLAPWLLGNHDLWDARSKTYRKRYRMLSPRGIDPSVFADRAAYGDYFEGQAQAKHGY